MHISQARWHSHALDTGTWAPQHCDCGRSRTVCSAQPKQWQRNSHNTQVMEFCVESIILSSILYSPNGIPSKNARKCHAREHPVVARENRLMRSVLCVCARTSVWVCVLMRQCCLFLSLILFTATVFSTKLYAVATAPNHRHASHNNVKHPALLCGTASRWNGKNVSEGPKSGVVIEVFGDRLYLFRLHSLHLFASLSIWSLSFVLA